MNKLKNYIRLQTPILDHQDKFIFLFNRKVGTHSVARHLLKDRCIIRKDASRTWAEKIKLYSVNDIDKIFKFTIIRNPWEKVVSAFHALQQYSKWKVPSDWTFCEFVKTVFKDKEIRFDIHFIYQYPKVYFEDEIYVDYVARMENINTDWKFIAKKLGCSSVLPHKNKSKHKPYQQYYDNECKEIIGNIYRKDIELFKYEF